VEARRSSWQDRFTAFAGAETTIREHYAWQMRNYGACRDGKDGNLRL
jgi:hypothetical protein